MAVCEVPLGFSVEHFRKLGHFVRPRYWDEAINLRGEEKERDEEKCQGACASSVQCQDERDTKKELENKE